MAGASGLKGQREPDALLRRVDEGTAEFDRLWDQVASVATSGREPQEQVTGELRRALGKLLRLRAQLRERGRGGDSCGEAMERIEQRTRSFGRLERAIKVEEAGTGTSSEAACEQTRWHREWLQRAISELEAQLAEFQADLELRLRTPAGAEDEGGQQPLAERCKRHQWHIEQLEGALRALNSGSLSLRQIAIVKEDVGTYLSQAGIALWDNWEPLYQPPPARPHHPHTPAQQSSGALQVAGGSADSAAGHKRSKHHSVSHSGVDCVASGPARNDGVKHHPVSHSIASGHARNDGVKHHSVSHSGVDCVASGPRCRLRRFWTRAKRRREAPPSVAQRRFWTRAKRRREAPLSVAQRCRLRRCWTRAKRRREASLSVAQRWRLRRFWTPAKRRREAPPSVAQRWRLRRFWTMPDFEIEEKSGLQRYAPTVASTGTAFRGEAESRGSAQRTSWTSGAFSHE
eukprot:TRINITY_DN1764_c0_g1_i3.p1 TRINITY_DN1764_c0_g1~~TRINITY_DN1764_c0_g1_i3.p1  ORF type:complete len:474 (-),score=71.92 TRINITY_DN1764_c0_g1_i3:951-2327(-)